MCPRQATSSYCQPVVKTRRPVNCTIRWPWLRTRYTVMWSQVMSSRRSTGAGRSHPISTTPALQWYWRCPRDTLMTPAMTTTSCPEVLACNKILQGVFQRVEPVHEPVSDSRDAKGRNEERQHKEHHAAQRLAAYEQDKGQQGQHHAAYMTQRRSHAVEK